MAAGAHLILGAGLGGLALADALLDEDVAGPVVLLDRRTTWPRDRTWCFWDVDVPYAGLATHRWAEWEVVTSEGTAVQQSDRHAYLRLPADRFYAHVLERLGRDPRVEVRTGVTVASEAEAQAHLPGATVHDARGPVLPPPGGLAQRFLGLEVKTEVPRFTPGRATLMDFRVSQDGGLHFMYVLPFSAREALVEDTWFAVEPVDEARHRAEIAAWIGGSFAVRHEERGVLPMTAAAVGAATVGGLRPSSGYAFARTVRHARALARATARDDPRPRPGTARWDWLDAVFLRALDADPAAFPERFRRLVARTPAGAFARFMTDASTVVDEAAVVAALPKVPFARAALARD
jgi:lycopene beta-cyclase